MCLEQGKVESNITKVVLKEGFFCVVVGRKVGRREGNRQNPLGRRLPLTLAWAGVVAEGGELEIAL